MVTADFDIFEFISASDHKADRSMNVFMLQVTGWKQVSFNSSYKLPSL